MTLEALINASRAYQTSYNARRGTPAHKKYLKEMKKLDTMMRANFQRFHNIIPFFETLGEIKSKFSRLQEKIAYSDEKYRYIIVEYPVNEAQSFLVELDGDDEDNPHTVEVVTCPPIHPDFDKYPNVEYYFTLRKDEELVVCDYFEEFSEGSTVLRIFNSDRNFSELLMQAGKTFAAYEEMDSDEVCQNYHIKKYELRNAFDAFYTQYECLVSVPLAHFAFKKIQKWQREYEDN